MFRNSIKAKKAKKHPGTKANKIRNNGALKASRMAEIRTQLKAALILL
jgi:hypothetical protein